MPRFKIRHVVAAGALALIATVPTAGCAGRTLSPLPVDAAETAPATTAGPTPTASPTGSALPGVAQPPTVRKPTKAKTTKSTAPSPTDCYRTRQVVDVPTTVIDLLGVMCFYTGVILRLQGIDPSQVVTREPADLAVLSYEAGGVDVTFVRRGTVTITIPQEEGQNHTITVVVVQS